MEGRPHATEDSRKVKVSCLAALLAFCAGLGLLTAAIRSGPFEVNLLGSNLRVGSEKMVLSNSSFQNGTTYFLDVDGNGVRNIIEVQYLTGNRAWELVLRHADHDTQDERHLLTLPLP